MIALKNHNEVEKIREACHIVFLAHEAVKNSIRIGMTTKEIDKIAEDVMPSASLSTTK